MSAIPSEVTLRHRTPDTRPNGWWGMVLLIATEATLFFVLLAGYFYLRFQSTPAWPPDGIDPPKLIVPGVMTALIVASSVPMWWAHRGIRHGRTRRLESGLLGTFFIGALFVAVQVHEFRDKLDHFKPQTDAYGSMFFTITGLHAAHVVVGLLLTLWTYAHTLRGSFTHKRYATVQATALYWHFMPAMWVIIFLALYVSPRA